MSPCTASAWEPGATFSNTPPGRGVSGDNYDLAFVSSNTPGRHSIRITAEESEGDDEVADRLHLSRQHVAVRLHRAHRLLRARLLGQR